jgi:hypothetical protein
LYGLDLILALLHWEGAARMDFQQSNRYDQEASETWGHTQAYQESKKRTSNYAPADWQRIQLDAARIYQGLAACMFERRPVQDSLVQQWVGDWQMHITVNFYPCSKDILAGLGMMYTSDARFADSIDQHGKGLAAYLSDAISVYCGK